MKKVTQNLHTDFSLTQAYDLFDYFSHATIEWECHIDLRPAMLKAAVELV
jgi:hypothetical protein